MSWPVAFAVVSALCNGTIGVLAYLRGRRDTLYRSFSLLNFCFAFWSLAFAVAWPDFESALNMKLLYTPLALIPAAALSFVWSFTGLPQAQRHRRTVPLYLAGAALLGMLWSRVISWRVFRGAFLAGGLPVFLGCLLLLYQHWRRAEEPAERNRRGYLLLASCFAVFGGLADGLPLVGLHLPRPGNASIMLYSLIVLAAITRHHLLDLRVAVKRGLTMLTASLLLSLVLTGIAWLTRQVEGALFLNFFVLSLVLMAALPTAWERLNRLSGRWFFARQLGREQALDALELKLERVSDLNAAAEAAAETIRSVWSARCEFLWARRLLRRVDAFPELPEPLWALLGAKSEVATLDSLDRDRRMRPLAEALRERRAQAVAPVARGGELVGAVLLSEPADGFYDLSGVRWLRRLAVGMGRAVEAAETAAALLHADRLAQLGTLAAGVAHEVRNPLSAMAGAAEMLGRPLAESERREYLGVLKEEVARLDGIVNELLDYASPKPEQARASWGEVWGKVERLARTDWPGAVALDCRAEDLALAVTPDHLRQILLNLLRNAARAARSSVAVSLRRRAGWAVLEVSDDGPGIPAELLPRLFTPFAKSSGGGAGLGLATVKRLAELYGGRAWAENLSPGACGIGSSAGPGGTDSLTAGARFTVELPAA
ncbi:MAG: ATP-binding protein [Elusimicrobia bacterium]|nr:ATP-binding protein [Elusimicrobiota bacterium]